MDKTNTGTKICRRITELEDIIESAQVEIDILDKQLEEIKTISYEEYMEWLN